MFCRTWYGNSHSGLPHPGAALSLDGTQTPMSLSGRRAKPEMEFHPLVFSTGASL